MMVGVFKMYSPNLALNFFGGFGAGGLLSFWIGIIKLNMLPTMWQNIATIGRWTSEISH